VNAELNKEDVFARLCDDEFAHVSSRAMQEVLLRIRNSLEDKVKGVIGLFLCVIGRLVGMYFSVCVRVNVWYVYCFLFLCWCDS
jgi:hypothetical protein